MNGLTTRMDHLAILGKLLEHEDQIEIILENLPEEYKQVVDQIERKDNPPPLSEVHERLLNHEAKLLSAAALTTSPFPVTANVAQQHQRFSNNNNNYRNNQPKPRYNSWQSNKQDSRPLAHILANVNCVVSKDILHGSVPSFNRLIQESIRSLPIRLRRGNLAPTW